jgi:hypothetical protein
MILTKIPLNGEHPYFFSKKENKHYWQPSWWFSKEPVPQIIKMVEESVRVSSCDPEDKRIFFIHAYTQEASDDLPAPDLTSQQMRERNHAGYYRTLMSYFKNEWMEMTPQKKQRHRAFWEKTKNAEVYWNAILEADTMMNPLKTATTPLPERSFWGTLEDSITKES